MVEGHFIELFGIYPIWEHEGSDQPGRPHSFTRAYAVITYKSSDVDEILTRCMHV